MNRVLRVLATGQWCGPMITDGTFPDDGTAWADAVCVTLGLQAGALAVVDGETDPRTGVLLEDPNVTAEAVPVAPQPTLADLQAQITLLAEKAGVSTVELSAATAAVT